LALVVKLSYETLRKDDIKPYAALTDIYIESKSKEEKHEKTFYIGIGNGRTSG